MKRMYGVVIPMVTPLTEDDHVDVLSLQRLTDFLIDKGVDCLYPCGTTGEMAYLTDDERILVVETVVRQAAGRSEHLQYHSLGPARCCLRCGRRGRGDAVVFPTVG